MSRFDVFNGDADGICALHQLRLAAPADSILITGVKRDIALLERVPAAAGDQVTVLDISLDRNRDALLEMLERGAEIHYFDHHFSGAIPAHPHFHPLIDLTPEVCTSLLVDRFLASRHRIWAVVGAFGDNLHQAARRAAAPLGLETVQLEQLQELGECLNYNAYGDTVADLLIPPDRLYRKLHPYADPFAFMAEEPIFRQLRQGYTNDLARAQAVAPEAATPRHALYILPDADWSRRISGVFSNRLAQQAPQRAHAVLIPNRQGGYSVSVRAPLATPNGADELCLSFASGGGRRAAAGINHLPPEQVESFAVRFRAAFGN